MKQIVTIATILLLISCSSNCYDVTSIKLPDNMKLLSGNYNNNYGGIDSEIKLIAYYDSTFCTNCAIKNFNIWKGYINTIESHNDCASIIFIFAPNQTDLFRVETMLNDYVVDYPVFVDTAYSFEKNNPQLQQSFFGIIDKDNNVLISGYPFDSSKKQKQYYELFKKLVNN